MADFSAQKGATFSARRDGRGFDLSLETTQDIVSNERQVNFSLEFRAPTDTPPEQGMYHLTNRELGELDLFLVPIKRDERGLYFEAVFNLVKSV